MKKIRTSYRRFQSLILLTGIEGRWHNLGNQKQYRTDDGAILNWWKTTGTIYLQGDLKASRYLSKQLDRVARR